MIIQGFCQKIWEARNQVLFEGIGNFATNTLSKDQVNTVKAILNIPEIPRNLPRAAQIRNEIQILNSMVAGNQFDGNPLSIIATKLDKIGQDVLNACSESAERLTIIFPLRELFRRAIIQATGTHSSKEEQSQGIETLHRLLTSHEFQELNPRKLNSEFMILPGIEWGTPEKLEELFKLLVEVGTSSSSNRAIEGAAATGMAAGVASGGDSQAAREAVRDQKLQFFQTKIADLLAPISFKILSRIGLDLHSAMPSEEEQKERKESVAAGKKIGSVVIPEAENKALDKRRQCLIASPLFQQMSPLVFEKQIKHFCKFLLCTFEAADLFFEIANLRMKKEDQEGQTQLLGLLAKEFDFFPPLRRAVATENLSEIDRLLSYKNLIKHSDRERLSEAFDQLQTQWSANPAQVRKLFPLFFHPAWAGVDYLKPSSLTLHLLCKIYNQQDFSMQEDVPMTQDIHSAIKDTALGKEKIRQPIEDLIQSKKAVNADQLLADFEKYQKSIEAASPRELLDDVALNRLEKGPYYDFRMPFRRNAANILIPRFAIAFTEALIQGKAVDRLLNSELFLYTNRFLVTVRIIRLFRDDQRIKRLKEGGRTKLLFPVITHLQWMNVHPGNFQAGFEAILEQKPIDCQKLKMALNTLPIFHNKKIWPSKTAFINETIQKVMSEIASLGNSNDSNRLKQELNDIITILDTFY